MIPLVNAVIYPYLRKKSSSLINENTRLVLGMSLSAMSVIAAGLLESFRINIILDNPTENLINQVIDNTTYKAANLHILWQIPQYTLIGLGEVFCSVSCLYYAYSAAPKSMQSILTGLFYFFTGIGSFMGSLTLFAFKPLIFSSTVDKDDINCPKCRLNYYFYFLAGLQIVGIVLFIVIDTKYSITRNSRIEEAAVASNESNNQNSNVVNINPDLNRNEDDIIDNENHYLINSNNTVNA